MVAVRFAFWE